MIEEQDYEVECHFCFGLGYIPEEADAECPYCDGTGFYADNDYDDESEGMSNG